MTGGRAVFLGDGSEKGSRRVDFAEGVADCYEDCDVDAGDDEGWDEGSENCGAGCRVRGAVAAVAIIFEDVHVHCV